MLVLDVNIYIYIRTFQACYLPYHTFNLMVYDFFFFLHK